MIDNEIDIGYCKTIVETVTNHITDIRHLRLKLPRQVKHHDLDSPLINLIKFNELIAEIVVAYIKDNLVMGGEK